MIRVVEADFKVAWSRIVAYAPVCLRVDLQAFRGLVLLPRIVLLGPVL